MDHIDWQFWGALMGFISLAFGMYKFQKSNIREQERMAGDIQSNQREIVRVDKRVEKVIEERGGIVKDIYQRMGEVTNTHNKDVRELHELIEESIERTRELETRHHEEVIEKIGGLTVQLTDMCSTFKEYRRTHNGNTGKKREDVDA